MKRCALCKKEKDLEEFYRHRKKFRQSRCKDCARETTKLWRRDNPNGAKKQDAEAKVKTRYGITRQEFEDINRSQKGLCAICNGQPTGGRKWLSIDHDHISGRVRGLLCNNCNAALGLLKDSTDIIREAIKYLEWSEIQMAENTTVGPAGANSSAMPVTSHKTYGHLDNTQDEHVGSGSNGGGVAGPNPQGENFSGDRGPAGSNGEPTSVGSPVNAGGMV